MPWYLRWLKLSKEQLFNLLLEIAKRALKRIWDDGCGLVRIAAKNPDLDTNVKKARWVASRLAQKYDTAEEWTWLWNLTTELCVAAVKKKAAKLTKFKLPSWLR